MKAEASSDLLSLLAGHSPSKKDVERRLAEMGLGLVWALQSGEMPLEQAQRDLFNLDTYQAVRKHRLSRLLVEFLQWGMELEDVAALTPEGLAESHEQMIALARRVIEASLPKKKRSKARSTP